MLWHTFSTFAKNIRSAGMTSTRTIYVKSCLLTMVLSAGVLTSLTLAQGNQYKARLAPAPPLGLRGERGGAFPTPASYVAGIGSATATLNGRKLTVTGSFEKMASPPTV